MNKKIIAALTVLFLFSSTAISANSSTDTNKNAPQPPKFEKGMMPPPDFNKNTSDIKKKPPIKNPPKDFNGGKPIQFKDKQKQPNKQFDGKTPPNFTPKKPSNNFSDKPPISPKGNLSETQKTD